ncbi:unnamed protein product, partial [Eretmochelys imbricata]
MFAHATVNVKALEVSYHASLQIAKVGKPHTIGEELILPAAKEFAFIICGEKTAKQLDCVPLSNDTVSRRIQHMAANVKDILVKHMNNSRYSALQLDETTDIAVVANLLAYIRYEWEGQ